MSFDVFDTLFLCLCYNHDLFLYLAEYIHDKPNYAIARIYAKATSHYHHNMRYTKQYALDSYHGLIRL